MIHLIIAEALNNLSSCYIIDSTRRLSLSFNWELKGNHTLSTHHYFWKMYSPKDDKLLILGCSSRSKWTFMFLKIKRLLFRINAPQYIWLLEEKLQFTTNVYARFPSNWKDDSFL